MEPRCVSVLDVCVRVLRTGMLLVSGFRRFGVREGAERTSDVRGARVGAVRGGRVGGLAEPASERREGGRAAQRGAAEFVCPDCEQAQHMGSREPARDVGAPRFHEKKTEYVTCCIMALYPFLHAVR
jgi:hypothetical protein